ncbi:MAG: DUF1292 domain-containing protein [Candidatus Cohnella colombiensis]|uniref:DUF1292 domain-containing protein n=1 Tax=Candidatus Cohnella colombiensis TaxID=3121368 RepID=A0AA95ETY4_9BACL|nr:MAG: DUF1292 domain-containing protein [Cohnella sp.]
MSDHVHDENCQHEHEEEDIIVLTDEDGTEYKMVLVDSFAIDDREYAILLDRDDPEDDAVILRIDTEGEDEVLVNIEDEAEWEQVMNKYEELVAESNNE